MTTETDKQQLDTHKITPTIIGDIEVFQGLTKKDYESLSDILKAQNYLAEQHIITLGEHTRDVYFIISGKVRITTFTSSGKEVTFQDMKAGQMFGELSAIDGESRSTNVVALTETQLARVSSSIFFKILRDYPKVNEKLLTQLTGLIRKLGDRIVEFSTYSVKSRIHAELLRLAKQSTIENNCAEIIPAPAHLDIANRISTHREAVSRELSELSKSGVLKRSEGKLIIQDITKLENLLNPHDQEIL